MNVNDLVISQVANVDGPAYALRTIAPVANGLLGTDGGKIPQAVTIGSNLSLVGGVLSATGGGAGTVTSVALTAPAIFSVGGSPITGAGTLALTLATQSANLVWAGPATGVASVPTFRSLVTADIPDLSATYQPLNAKLTSISALANAAGWLHNDGSGVFAYSTPTAAQIGATTVGGNLFALANPSAITFIRINADNSVSTLDAASFRTAIGAGTGSGTVTNVTGTAPVVSSGGTTPAISMPQSSGVVDGYLSATDWAAFNSKQPAGNYITALTGDVTASGPGSVAVTVVKVNGVAYGTSPATNTVPVVTGANTVTYEAVPNAALANASITIGGASTALGGSVTATTILDSIGLTRGSILYRGASGWAILAPTTAGYVLTDGGVGADPSWQAEGHVGTVTSFSAGNLSPLFTTSVATATTTPALSFSLNTQVQKTFLAGPTSGADAAPTFRTIEAADLPAGTTPTGANPTANIGFTAVNGSAATFMRSDAAPALPQAIILSRIYCHC